MKILYITTIGGTMNFFKTFIKGLVEDGHTVDMACNDSVSKPADMYSEIGCKIYSISTSRSPFSKGNITAIKQIRNLVEKNGYDIVHCHTPLAAMATRLACIKARKKGLRVIYTAHGFHFYKGAPIKNWMIYYTIEKICSLWTDVLVTINKEDYHFSSKHMHAKRVEYVPGVGIDVDRFRKADVVKSEKRHELGIDDSATVVLSVGELNENKNHETVIRAISKLKNEDIVYLICGKGAKGNYLRSLAQELGVNLVLAGFRKDIPEILKCSDIFAFPSKREGLPVSLMETMASGLPAVCSRIRGITDLVDDGINGFLCDPLDAEAFAEKIKQLAEDINLRKKMAEINETKILGFGFDKVDEKIRRIYNL